MAVRITCIKKPGDNLNPHEAIQELGWINESTGNKGRSTREEMHDWLKNRGGVAYVLDGNSKAFLYPRENSNGTRYVQTVSNGIWADNLLSLQECS